MGLGVGCAVIGERRAPVGSGWRFHVVRAWELWKPESPNGVVGSLPSASCNGPHLLMSFSLPRICQPGDFECPKQSQARTTQALDVDLSLHFSLLFEIQSLSACLTSNTASPPIQLLELPDMSLLGISLAIQINHGKI